MRKPYDYENAAFRAAYDARWVMREGVMKRVLRKLVREAVMEFADAKSCEWPEYDNDKKHAQAIARRLVP